MLKSIFAIASVLLLTGCAVQGPSFKQIEASLPAIKEGYGRVYFMNAGRPHARVAVDKQVVGECKIGAFFWEDLTAGTHVVTVDSPNDFGAWDESLEVIPGQDHFIRITPRRGQTVANALFGPLGYLVESSIASEGQSGTFQAEALNPQEGQAARSKLVYFRETPSAKEPSSIEDRRSSATESQTILNPTRPTPGKNTCSVDQVLAMKSAGMMEQQIKAACK
jgi:hypothetical protein